MKIVKIAGRMIKVYIMGVKMPDGTIVKKVMLGPNQQLGTSCHKITEHIQPTGTISNSWSDPDKTDYNPELEQQQQQSM
jgi:hypothetical protein